MFEIFCQLYIIYCIAANNTDTYDEHDVE